MGQRGNVRIRVRVRGGDEDLVVLKDYVVISAAPVYARYDVGLPCARSQINDYQVGFVIGIAVLVLQGPELVSFGSDSQTIVVAQNREHPLYEARQGVLNNRTGPPVRAVFGDAVPDPDYHAIPPLDNRIGRRGSIWGRGENSGLVRGARGLPCGRSGQTERGKQRYSCQNKLLQIPQGLPIGHSTSSPLNCRLSCCKRETSYSHTC